MESTVGACAPPSAVQPKFETHAREGTSAEAESGTRSMRNRTVWCYPGKGTPSSSRVSLAHEKRKCVVLWASLVLGRDVTVKYRTSKARVALVLGRK